MVVFVKLFLLVNELGLRLLFIVFLSKVRFVTQLICQSHSQLVRYTGVGFPGHRPLMLWLGHQPKA